MIPLLIAASIVFATFLSSPMFGLVAAVTFAFFAFVCLVGKSEGHTKDQHATAALTFALISLLCFFGHLYSSTKEPPQPAGVEITSEVQSLG